MTTNKTIEKLCTKNFFYKKKNFVFLLGLSLVGMQSFAQNILMGAHNYTEDTELKNVTFQEGAHNEGGCESPLMKVPNYGVTNTPDFNYAAFRLLNGNAQISGGKLTIYNERAPNTYSGSIYANNAADDGRRTFNITNTGINILESYDGIATTRGVDINIDSQQKDIDIKSNRYAIFASAGDDSPENFGDASTITIKNTSNLILQASGENSHGVRATQGALIDIEAQKIDVKGFYGINAMQSSDTHQAKVILNAKDITTISEYIGISAFSGSLVEASATKVDIQGGSWGIYAASTNSEVKVNSPTLSINSKNGIDARDNSSIDITAQNVSIQALESGMKANGQGSVVASIAGQLEITGKYGLSTNNKGNINIKSQALKTRGTYAFFSYLNDSEIDVTSGSVDLDGTIMARDAKLTLDVKGEEPSKINSIMMARNGGTVDAILRKTTFTGITALGEGGGTLNLHLADDQNTWHMLGDSELTHLTLDGASVRFEGKDDQGNIAYNTLTMDKLSGNDGHFHMRTAVADGKGDYINITTGSGEHKVTVKDSGKEIADPLSIT